MTWKNNLPESTQVCFDEMCLRVTVKLKASYLVSKTENSLAQATTLLYTNYFQAFSHIGPRTGGQGSISVTSRNYFYDQCSQSKYNNMLYCSQEELIFFAYNHLL